MCRVAESCFKWLNTVQPSMSGKKISRMTAAGRNRQQCFAIEAAVVEGVALKVAKFKGVHESEIQD